MDEVNGTRVVTRDLILGLVDRKPVAFPVPEWEITIWLRPLSSAERSEWETRIRRADIKAPSVNARELLAVLTISDEEGNRLFTVEDIEALSEKSGAALERIGMRAAEINALRPEDIKELAKKS